MVLLHQVESLGGAMVEGHLAAWRPESSPIALRQAREVEQVAHPHWSYPPARHAAASGAHGPGGQGQATCSTSLAQQHARWKPPDLQPLPLLLREKHWSYPAAYPPGGQAGSWLPWAAHLLGPGYTKGRAPSISPSTGGCA